MSDSDEEMEGSSGEEQGQESGSDSEWEGGEPGG